MARWRAEALKGLPELRKKINSADNIMALWIEALYAFEQAYRGNPPDESLIARVYAFADWCMGAPRGPDAGHDPLSAVMIGFYESIPTFPAAREDMPRWFTYDEVAQSRAVFSYLIGDEEYQRLLEHMRKNISRYRPRASLPMSDQ
jgi:hypothetical protein